MSTSEIKNPHNCGNSVLKNGVAICQLSCFPCSVIYKNESCELTKIEKSHEYFAKLLWGDKSV